MKPIMIKLGGSLVAPKGINGPDTEFLTAFKEIIVKRIRDNNEKFVINVGGGSIARYYQDALKRMITNPSADNLDLLGIGAIHINAFFVMCTFEDLAYPVVCNTLDQLRNADSNSPIIIVGAEEPGHSSNMDAVLAAQIMDVSTIINMSNVDYVYAEDPLKNPNAEKFETISWKHYLKCIPEKWDPGMSTPFDPVSSREAQRLGLTVVFMKGDRVSNLMEYLETDHVAGTVIQPEPVSVER